jgi:plastocyanin
MLDAIWTWILDLVALLVTPDWGSLIGLLPVAVMALVLVWVVWMIRRFRIQPRARRGKMPIPRKTPAGIHMPGPSFAPVFAAIGVALLFFGLVWGGPILILGIVALVLTLLYWLAEGMRIYDHDIGGTAPQLPAVIHDGPPPGVHMPGPSFRPIVGAVGMAILFFGLVYGGWMLIAGVLALVATLVGWLVDAVADYRRTVEADRTGHVSSGPVPRTPSLLFSTLAVVFVGGILLQTGLLPPGKANGDTGAGASGSPAPSGAAASGAPASSGAAPSSGPAITGDVNITAQNVAYVQTSFTAKANTPFTIAFSNEDPGVTHNIEIVDPSGAPLWKGVIFPGVETRLYQVPALGAGEYTFVCSVHASMTGRASITQ